MFVRVETLSTRFCIKIMFVSEEEEPKEEKNTEKAILYEEM